jgi:hypothetical protein
MKSTIKPLIGILAIGMLALASCKKKEDDSARARLIGKWKLTQTAVDANNNGVMDASEVTTEADSNVTYFTFKSDGNGEESFALSGLNFSVDFTWSLESNDQKLRLIDKSGSATPSGNLMNIETLTGSDLVIRDSAMAGTAVVDSWTIFKKQ